MLYHRIFAKKHMLACSLSMPHTQTVTHFLLWRHTLPSIHAKIQILPLLLLQSSPCCFPFCTVSCSTSAEITTVYFPLPHLSDISSFLLLLFSYPHSSDLQYLNVVLCLQSADEIVICHINSPPPLSYIHTHTHIQSFPSMAPFTESHTSSIILPFLCLLASPSQTSCHFTNAFFSFSPQPLLFFTSPLHTSCGVMCDLTS